MPWYLPWSESIKKRACRYLLQHYLGRFLQTKLGLDQLSIDLYKGTGCVKNVNLDVEVRKHVMLTKYLFVVKILTRELLVVFSYLLVFTGP